MSKLQIHRKIPRMNKQERWQYKQAANISNMLTLKRGSKLSQLRWIKNRFGNVAESN